MTKPVENVLDVLDATAITNASLSLPIDVNLSRDETPIRFGWQNLSSEQMHFLRNWVREFAFKTSDDKIIQKSFALLNESKFDTHIGYAKKGNVGHSNAATLYRAIINQDEIKKMARNEAINDAQFCAFFFDVMPSISGIGIDTISDFIIFMNLESLKEFTRMAWDAQNDEFKKEYPLSKDKTIKMNDKNILLIPDNYVREGGYAIYKNGTPLAWINLVTKMRVKINNNTEWMNVKSRTSAQSILTRLLNKVKKLSEKQTTEEIKTIIQSLNGKATKEVIALVNFVEYIDELIKLDKTN